MIFLCNTGGKYCKQRPGFCTSNDLSKLKHRRPENIPTYGPFLTLKYIFKISLNPKSCKKM